jgi:hypothetical protein
VSQIVEWFGGEARWVEHGMVPRVWLRQSKGKDLGAGQFPEL